MGLFSRKAKDLVCGMDVDPKSPGGGSVEHAGKTYHFCSASCRAKFQAAPAQYA